MADLLLLLIGQQGPQNETANSQAPPTFRDYVRSIIYMPASLRILCVTNLFSWMSLVCYSLYFTDFVGESVFGGDPTAPRGSDASDRYRTGVRFGCIAMTLYSFSCACYSYCFDRLVKRFGAKTVYISGQLAYSLGMLIVAVTHNKVCTILFSFTSGLQYATLFTMPYLLIAQYHAYEVSGKD